MFIVFTISSLIAEAITVLLSGGPIDDRLAEIGTTKSVLAGNPGSPSRRRSARNGAASDDSDESETDSLFIDEEAPGLFGDETNEPVDPEKERLARAQAAFDQWDEEAEEEDDY